MSRCPPAQVHEPSSNEPKELVEQFVLSELNWQNSSFERAELLEQFVLSELNWSDISLKLTIGLRSAMV
jgi:hypothetical protein